MRSTGLRGLAPRVHDSLNENTAPIASPRETITASAVARPMPFVERRRSKALEHSWMEALECVQRHLTGFEQTNRRLEQSERRYRELIERAPLGIFQTDATGKLLILNRAMTHIFGFESQEAAAASGFSCDAEVLRMLKRWQNLHAADESAARASVLEAEIACAGGSTKWVRLHVRAAEHEQGLAGFEGIAEEITDRKLVEARTEALAYYDLLTGLPNRTLLRERLAKELTAARILDSRVALFDLEIERFRAISDSRGTVVGDRLLQEFAARIRTSTRDDVLAARIGPAEFAVVFPDVSSSDEAENEACALVAALQAEHTYLGHSFNVGCNLGISLFPENGADEDTLLVRAEVALSFARESETSSVNVFTEMMNESLAERRAFDFGLRQALDRNELYLVYQPQVDIQSGAVTGLEALLRWHHGKLGLIPPNKFIAVAENSGLIVPIGEWVLRSACAQARTWEMAGLPAVPVAVNVSAVQFRQHDFCDVVQNVLNETGLDPGLLELELTESLLLSNADEMSLIAAKLREMGVKLAIDDFGTGYSSLGYLKHFKVNRLKIDRSFIKDVPADADDAAITTAIIEMARALNVSVLAEGVEKEDQLEFLYNQQCYNVQGYYFSKPVNADEIYHRLQTGFGHLIPTQAERLARQRSSDEAR